MEYCDMFLLCTYYIFQYQRTALHWAANNGHVEVVKVLLEAGADVNAVDKVCIYLYIRYYIYSLSCNFLNTVTCLYFAHITK